MRAQPPTLRSWLRRAVVGATAVLLLLPVGWADSAASQPADRRLRAAQERRQALQQRLDDVLQRVRLLEAEASELAERLERLAEQQAAHERTADAAAAAVAKRVRASYMHGSSDPALTLFASDSPQQAVQASRLLAMLALRAEAELEAAAAAHVRTEATADEVERAAARLSERRAELDARRAEARRLVADAELQEDRVRAVLAAERAQRQRRARERAKTERVAAVRTARRRASRGAETTTAAGAAASGTSSRGRACPMGQPRTYSDTYGAPRSGGRSHLGTDILAPHGTPIYAIESGTITRTDGSHLGGISLYLRGDSGTLYYYTHLSGYVAGMSPGRRVGAGTQIAYNGDSGNAAGIPHLHIEVMPGGGGNVNPYPYVARACG